MTPLILFTGFLGSGKTTFLRGLLPHLTAAGLEPHVILNDYQNAHVDASSLRQVVEKVVPISGNCVCCGSRDEMFDALAAAQLTLKSVMLVEANGTVDAIQLIELISSDLRAEAYTLPWQLAVVDVKRWQRRHLHNELEARQLKTATHLYLSHVNDQDAARKDQVMSSVSKQNPNASWVSPESFASKVTQLAATALNIAPRVLRSIENNTHLHHHDDHNASHHFASMELPLPDGLEHERLEVFLRALPSEVIRAKGLVRLAGHQHEFTVFDYLGADQGVQFRTYKGDPDVASLFIAIGPRLPLKEIQASFSRIANTPLSIT